MTGWTSRRTSDVGPAPATATTTSGAAVVAWREVYRPADVPIPDGFEDIDAVVADIESSESGRARLASARQRLVSRLRGRVGGLAELRMRRGLSQKQLAEAIGTSQPHIARIENGRDNVLLATANELARALGVTLEDISAALGVAGRTP